MQKHTPGRLRAEGLLIVMDDEVGPLVAQVADELMHVEVDGEQATADAERLAACWNACLDINPEAVPELLKAHDTNVADALECFANTPPEAEDEQGEMRALPGWARGWIADLHKTVRDVLNRGEAMIAAATRTD